MNTLAIKQENAVVISDSTKELIRAGVSENTPKAYRRALKELDAWTAVEESGSRINTNGNGGHSLNDVVVATVKWRGLEDAVGEITLRSLAGIRREGRECGS